MTQSATKPLHIVVLAAGQGKRMRSALPKVLQPLSGRPLLEHVLDTARTLDPAAIHVVYGHGGEKVQAYFDAISDLTWVEQAEQKGTGHAVQMAIGGIPDDAQVLVMYGDCPLLTPQTLRDLLENVGACGVLSARVPDPAGYGRIVRGEDQQFAAIIEHRDCTPEQLAIDEINSGITVADGAAMRDWLGRIKDNNSQGEYYLTDIIALARADGVSVNAVLAADSDEILGINDRWQLAQMERLIQRRIARSLCDDGANLADPDRIDVRGKVSVGHDVAIDINCVFIGEVSLSDEVIIGPNCVIKDSWLGPGTRVHANSVLEGVITDGDCDVGPFARLRPGTMLGERTKVGNFVEIKKAEIGAGSKTNHLSYVGDAEIGENVNIGAGCITCNYDGANKHLTVIGDGAFIGSDCQLVAPVTVEQGATIGAGSTITKTAPADQLTLSRSKQVSVSGWQRPKKKPR